MRREPGLSHTQAVPPLQKRSRRAAARVCLFATISAALASCAQSTIATDPDALRGSGHAGNGVADGATALPDALPEAGALTDLGPPPDVRPALPPCSDGDDDGDGFGTGASCAGPDCDDRNGVVHPDAPEACNGGDDDCDGRIDERLGQRACGDGVCRTLVDNCQSGRPQLCVPAAPQSETCNGLDDDCDLRVDEDAGVTVCGQGSCERVAECQAGVEQPCVPGAAADEQCNRVDDDCDGKSDEGFHTESVQTTYTDLRTHHETCDGSGYRVSPGCNAAMHRFCGGRGCKSSGFGPLENSGDVAAVACVGGGETIDVPFATLSAIQGGCAPEGQRIGAVCNSAIHRYCAAAGFATGFGPVESGADHLVVTCLPATFAELLVVPYAELSTRHGPCNGQPQVAGPDCNAAINRHCSALGFVTGFGPVEHNGGDTATIACLRP